MNQPYDSARRRLIADASSGFPEQVRVVLYALVSDGGSPLTALTYLRRQAEARGWIVHSEFFDLATLTSARSERPSWPKVERLLQNRDVAGVVARSEDEIAFDPTGKEHLRNWLHAIPAFAKYPDPPAGGLSGSTTVLRRGW
ncbi:hypothetical protein ACSNOK_11790 [Streptomyces sp. URMC 126]|uniref:hypothetical protein n=1 Tax=Streptomyces sp. URMC 126 TaxID=3423401 RepID=UPI003F1D405C